MFTEEIKETVFLAVTLFILSIVLVFFMYGMRLRSDMAQTYNAEVQTSVELKSYRQFNKYIAGEMFSEDAIEAIRNFIGTGVEVYVDKTNQGPIHLKREMTAEQVEKLYSIEQLQEIFTLGQEYEVFLVYNFEDVTKAKPSKDPGRFTEVTGVVFKRR